MKNMFLTPIDERVRSEVSRGACDAESVQLTHQIKLRGQHLAANPLNLMSRATEPTPPTSTLDNDNRQETKP